MEQCSEKGDVRAHFTKLRTMREDLAAMGQPPSEDEFYAIVMGSLPPSYDPYLSAVNTTSSVIGTTLSADDLMNTVTDEYERRGLNARAGKKEKNVAFYTNDSKRGSSSSRRGGKPRSSKKHIECFNCKRKGHYQSECWAEGGPKEGQGPAKEKGKEPPSKDNKSDEKGKKKVEAAASAHANNDEAWMAILDSDSEELAALSPDSFVPISRPNTPSTLISETENASLFEGEGSDGSDTDNKSVWDGTWDSEEEMPGLAAVDDGSDSEDDEPKVEEPGSDNQAIEGENSELDPPSATDITPNFAQAFTSTFAAATLQNRTQGSLADVELYDSGASCHMSGYRHRFINFMAIEPQSITAADRRSFSAIRKGDMWVELPNGKEKSKVLLRDVLYAPTMGVTLISISRIVASGSAVFFVGTSCKIYNRNKVNIGKIEVENGLY